MRTSKNLRSAFQFFLANAGYVVGARAKCALSLARAEKYAAEMGWEVEWEFDQYSCEDSLGDHALWCSDERAKRDHEHEILCAVLKDSQGEVRASLGAIIDPDRTYRRVVEAELAHEAMPGNVP